MAHRWIFVVLAAFALLLTGCGSDKVVITTPTAKSSAADTMAKFDPPADVQEALDHFVEVGGAQFDDPDYDEMNSRIDEWSSAVCPQ